MATGVREIKVLIDDAKGPVVRPAVVTLFNKQPVVLANRTQDTIRVFIPTAGINELVEPGTNNGTLDGKLAALPSGRHRYAVYCHEVDDFAEGASSPEIIIKP